MKPSEAIKIINGLIKSVELAYNSNPLTDKEQHPATEALNSAISALEKQEQDRWIPVMERLPENYSNVLVWFEYFRYGNYNCMFQTHGIGNYSKKYDSWTVNHESGWSNLRVFAWRPLPEPYTEEES